MSIFSSEYYISEIHACFPCSCNSCILIVFLYTKPHNFFISIAVHEYWVISICWLDKKERKSLSRVRLFATPWTVAYQALPSMGFSRHEYWNGLPFPSPGDFPTQGLKLGLPHCRQTLYHLIHQGSPSNDTPIKLILANLTEVIWFFNLYFLF